MALPQPSRVAAALAARLLGVRWLVRAPIWLFRARLGFVTGSRLLMLEHIGRRSGQRRYVVLEIVDRPSRGAYVVASGFGQRSQWYRNIQANPSVRVFTGAHAPRAATARALDTSESRAALGAYAAKHPRTWRSLRPVFEATLGAQIDEHGTNLPLVCLDTTGPAQPGSHRSGQDTRRRPNANHDQRGDGSCLSGLK